MTLQMTLQICPGQKVVGGLNGSAFPLPCFLGNPSSLQELVSRNRAAELTGLIWQCFTFSSCKCKSVHQLLSRKHKGWIHFFSLGLLSTNVIKMNVITVKNTLEVMTASSSALVFFMILEGKTLDFHLLRCLFVLSVILLSHT